MVVIGTKCNRLLCLDVATGSVTEIPLPIAQAQPQSSSPVPFSAPRYGNCGIHAIAVSPDQRLLATGGFDPAHCQVFEFDIASDGSNRVTFRPAQTLVVSLAVTVLPRRGRLEPPTGRCGRLT